MSSQAPADSGLFLFPSDDQPINVDYGCNLFLADYSNRALAKYSAVRRVTHFKDTRNVNHELLLIEVVFSRDSEPDIATFLQTERAVAKGGNESSARTSPSTSSVSVAALSDDDVRVRAKNVLFVPGFHTRRKESFDKRTKFLRNTHDVLNSIFELN